MITSTKDFKKVHVFCSTVSKRGSKADNYQIIKAIDVIYWKDPKNPDAPAIERTIRLIEGATSIFADEQKEINRMDKADIDKMIVRLHMKDNVMFVDPQDVNKLQFLRLTNKNGSNPNRKNSAPALFYEHDPEKVAREINETEDVLVDALYKAKTMSIEEGIAYLLTLTDNPVYAQSLESMSVSEIRHDLRALAKRNPKAFVDGMKTTEMKNKYHIMMAISSGIIKTDPSGMHLMWADGGLILSSVVGKKAVDWLAEMATKDADKAAVLDDLKLRVSNQRPASSIPDVHAPNMTLGGKPNEAKELYDKAKAYKIIWHKGVTVLYAPSPDVPEVEFANFKEFMSRIETDEMFRTEIANKVMAEELLISEKQTNRSK